MRRISVDRIGQFARKSREQLLLGQSCLPRQRVQYVRSDRLLKLHRGDRLIGARSHPRIRGFAVATLPKAIDEFCEPAAQNAAGGRASEAPAKLIKHPGKAAARTS